MDEIEKYMNTNRSLWDGWTEINKNSKLYDLDGFKAIAAPRCISEASSKKAQE